jgi:hypothetical protein
MMSITDDAMAMIADDAPRDVESFKALLALYDQAEGIEQQQVGQCIEGFIVGIGDPVVLAECMELAGDD